ncbi:MAG: hypothetical protein ACRD6W_07695, partial [Nitrososphaerales archaeon]
MPFFRSQRSTSQRWTWWPWAALTLALAVLGDACSSPATPSGHPAAPTTTSAAGTSTTVGSMGYATTVVSSGEINPAAIPLGDGYLSTTPKVGYVDSCITSFPSGGGAEAAVPWID